MARHRPTIEEWELYVPNVDDERQLFASSPEQAITMEIKFLSKREREHLERIAKRAEKGPVERARSESEFRRIFDEHVRNITNVTIDDGVPIVSGSELFDSNEEDIKTDITKALMMIGHLESGLGKKLSTPSATSSSRQMRNADGDAQNVIQASSQDS